MKITIKTVTNEIKEFNAKNICIKNGILYTGKTQASAEHSFPIGIVTSIDEENVVNKKQKTDTEILNEKAQDLVDSLQHRLCPHTIILIQEDHAEILDGKLATPLKIID